MEPHLVATNVSHTVLTEVERIVSRLQKGSVRMSVRGLSGVSPYFKRCLLLYWYNNVLMGERVLHLLASGER